MITIDNVPLTVNKLDAVYRYVKNITNGLTFTEQAKFYERAKRTW